MPFNPYSTRPIGSAKYEEHLLDVFTKTYYDQPDFYEHEDLEKVASTGRRIWNGSSHDPFSDPASKLAIAVIMQSVEDYLQAYSNRERAREEGSSRDIVYDSQCIQLENDFFRTNNFTEHILDTILQRLHSGESPKHMKTMIYQHYNKYISKGRV